MDNPEKRFRGRIIPKGEGVEEIPFDQGFEDKKREELQQQLKETVEALKDQELSQDRLSELWRQRRELEKKLDLEDKKDKPSTGVYL